MDSTTLISSELIDGIIVNTHDLQTPISRPADLHTVLVKGQALIKGENHDIGKATHYGMSTNLSEVTKELSKYDLQSRIRTTYFGRKLEAFLKESGIVGVDIESVIEQLSNTIVCTEDAGKKLGNIYSADSDAFAKIVINDIWSIRMWRKPEGWGSLNKELGFYGTFDMSVPGGGCGTVDGSFQLVHRETVYGKSRMDFITSRSIDRSDYNLLQDWLAQEFIDRWAFLMPLEVQTALNFQFDESCFYSPSGISDQLQMAGVTVPAGSQLGKEGAGIIQRMLPGGLVAAFQTDTLIQRRLAKLRPGVEIQILGTVSTVIETIVLDTPTGAGTWLIIRSKADDGETFMFLVGARHSDDSYPTGIPVHELATVLFTV